MIAEQEHSRNKLTPWWHHPNAKYVGRHRGSYEYWPNVDFFPYGVRNILIRPYLPIGNEKPMKDMVTVSRLIYAEHRGPYSPDYDSEIPYDTHTVEARLAEDAIRYRYFLIKKPVWLQRLLSYIGR